MNYVEVVRGLGLGGVETLLFRRLRYAVESGRIDPSDVRVINTYPQQGHYRERIRELGIQVLEPGSGGRIASSAHLAGAVRELGPDTIVVVHSPFPAAVIKSRGLLRRPPFPLVEVSHNTRYHRATLELNRGLNRVADLCIAVSDDVARSATTRGFRHKRTVLAGVDREEMRSWIERSAGTAQELRASIGVTGGRRLLVAVGRLVPEKGHHRLLDAVAQLGDPQLHLAVLGAGPEEQSLRRRIRELGLGDRVHLLGRVSDGWQWIAASDALVHPSDFEGLPVTIVEARVLGVPVVATDVGGVAQVLEGGRLTRTVPPNDQGALRAAILEVLTAAPPFPDAFPARASEATYWDMGRYVREFYTALEECAEARKDERRRGARRMA